MNNLSKTRIPKSCTSCFGASGQNVPGKPRAAVTVSPRCPHRNLRNVHILVLSPCLSPLPLCPHTFTHTHTEYAALTTLHPSPPRSGVLRDQDFEDRSEMRARCENSFAWRRGDKLDTLTEQNSSPLNSVSAELYPADG